MQQPALWRVTGFGLLCIAVFVIGRLAGNANKSSQPDSLEANQELASASVDEQAIHVLPDALAKRDFRLIAGGDPNSVMFVHPASRSWFEVPKPPVAQQVELPNAATFGFVGPDQCAECHRELFDSSLKTSHYLSSALPSPQNMLGPYSGQRSTMKTAGPDLLFEMEQDTAGRYYQNVVFRDLRKRIGIDLVTGSGHFGQTYLFWQGTALYQMHVSYFRQTDGWINSPGYQDGTAWYTRTVPAKCVECHATFASWIPGTENQYVRESLVLGVSCERCHGPGKAHVDFHHQNPQAKESAHIVNPSKLTREQNNDVCAQCHFGSGERKQGQPFSFRPGDKVSDHWRIDPKSEGVQGGVHSSNQLSRLSLSNCFIKSGTLTCIDCHRTHHNDRGDLKFYSQKCLQCHQPEHCGAAARVGDKLTDNCIDCHMAFGEDDHIALNANNTTQFPLLRDHFIRILPTSQKAGE